MSNRNTNAHFELAPQVETERSTFSMDSNVKTTFNVSELVPFYCLEVLPGDSFEIETAKVARLQTLITPVMDNLYLDTYYFFVPTRLIWKNWKYFMGESERAWTPTNSYTVPQMYADEEGALSGSIWDYFGLPINTPDLSVSALPFRAYVKIVNDWFRDQNLENPFLEIENDATSYYSDSNFVYGGKPYKACKYHDYFTSCLPAPQKGPDVTFLNGYAPVSALPFDVPEDALMEPEGTGVTSPLFFKKSTDYTDPTAGYVHTKADGETALVSHTGTYAASITPSNLWADLTYSDPENYSFIQFNTINSLRQAFQIQRMLERDARAGTRLIEVIQAHFGVSSPDARMQRAEYLGGNRVPLNIQQVTQTSSTDSTSPIGYQAGWSQTNDDSYDVNKSFTEHGYIIGLMVARYDHTYQQGINRMWSRKTRYDYYWPALAHLGEQAVKVKEIYCNGSPLIDDLVFGYQEAWAEYRYIPNIVTGEMRSGISNSLDVWHFADYYATRPFLSSGWIKEDKANVDRTLAVTSSVSDQILVDVFIKNKATRPMPLYSIPGLIDHF